MPLPAGFRLESQPAVTGLPQGFRLESEPATGPKLAPGVTFYKGQYFDQSGIPLDGPIYEEAPAPAQPAGSLMDQYRQALGVAEQGQREAWAPVEAVTKNIVNMPGSLIAGAAEPIGAALSGKFGTQEGVRAGEELSRKIAGYTTLPMSPEAQKLTQGFMEATGPLVGLQPELAMAGRFAEPAAAQAVRPAQRALAAREVRKSQALSDVSWQNAAKIDAAKAANRVGLAINPAEVNPTRGNRARVGIAGETNIGAANTKANENRLIQLAREDNGIPTNEPLTSAAYEKSRAPQYAVYDEARQLGTLAPTETVMGDLTNLRLNPKKTANPEKVARVNAVVDRVSQQIAEGLTGDEVIGQIRDLRNEARVTLRRQEAKAIERDVAQAQLDIASALEDLIDSNISDPAFLERFRGARTQLAKSHDWERATNPVTKKIEVDKIVKLAEKGRPLSGNLADVAQAAGNFPKDFGTAAPKNKYFGMGVRSTFGGSLGAGIGYGLGGPIGGIVGSALGAVGTNVLGARRAARYATPEMQNRLAVPPDYRLYQPAGAGIPRLGFDPASTVVAGTEGPSLPQRPNWVYGRPDVQVTPTRPDLTNALPAPSAEATMNALRTEQARAGQMSRQMGAAEEARMAAAEAAAPRAATRGGTAFDFDPITGRLVPAREAAGAALPQRPSIQTAADKIASEQMFNMTAPEKVMWERTKVNLAEVMPGMKALNDKAIAAKIMDRQWAQQAVTKAREQAAAFEQIAQRAKDQQTKMQAMARREEMMSLAEDMEAQLSMPRATSKGKGQGPKTLAAKRNQLRGDVEILNNLLD